MAQSKSHDYHLVNPSIWPLFGSLSAFIMAVGAVFFMQDMSLGAYKPGTAMLVIGLLGVLYTMLCWWREVVIEAEHQGHHTPVVQLHHRYGVILFIASEVMFFVAWFWAYFNFSLFPDSAPEVVRTAFMGGVWPPEGIQTFNPWHLPLLNTLILLLSGTTVTWAHHAIIHDDREGLKQGLWCTVGLGFLFTLLQAYEYSHAAFSFSNHIYGATFYMATGFHGFHVIVGTIFLAICLLRAYMGHFKKDHHFGFESAAWYWHFVDVVWLFLFATIYVWGYGGAVAGAGH